MSNPESAEANIIAAFPTRGNLRQHLIRYSAVSDFHQIAALPTGQAHVRSANKNCAGAAANPDVQRPSHRTGCSAGGRRRIVPPQSKAMAITNLANQAFWYNTHMRHIGTHLKRAAQRVRVTERGELMEYFCKQLNYDRLRDGLPPISMGRMGKTLQKIPTKDLYYLKKVCEDSKNFSKRFWYELNPGKHDQGS